MEQIHDMTRLKAVLQAQLKPGVVANAAADAAGYQRDLDTGALYMQPFPGGAYLFRRRGGFARMQFFAEPGAALPVPEWPEPLVMEIARRAQSHAMDWLDWTALGFRWLFDRQRLTRRAGEDTDQFPSGVRPAAGQDAVWIETLLLDCYNPVTSCLPTREELRAEIGGGQFLVLEDGCGLLHMTGGAGHMQVRHIAVASAHRRQGAAQRLMDAFLSLHGGCPSRVWITTTNAPSMGLFQKNGFVPDHWISTVWRRDTGKDAVL